jgi:hypothetical protein
LQNNKGKVYQGVVVEEGVPSDPAHTTALNKIMDCVREHQATGSGELYQKDTVEITGLDQGQVSKGIKKLIAQGKLAMTDKRAIYIPL